MWNYFRRFLHLLRHALSARISLPEARSSHPRNTIPVISESRISIAEIIFSRAEGSRCGMLLGNDGFGSGGQILCIGWDSANVAGRGHAIDCERGIPSDPTGRGQGGLLGTFKDTCRRVLRLTDDSRTIPAEIPSRPVAMRLRAELDEQRRRPVAFLTA